VARVFRTSKERDHAVHHVEGDLSVGDEVHGTVDWNLRMDHTRSHTATHIMNQAVRRVLGQHSWQAGTQKYADCARVDMTHFRRPTVEELHAIEHLANRIVMENRRVTATWYRRDEAEKKYGLKLLQGGIPKGRAVRVVAIAGRDDEPWDVEYCGGTHCGSTSDVGPIRLYRTERVQDGVERFEYAAGHHGVDRWQSDERLLREAASELQVAPNELPAAVRRFFAEWKEQRKVLDEVRKQLADARAAAATEQADEVAGVRIVVQEDLDAASLQDTAARLVAEPKTVALLAAPPADGATGPVRLLFGRSSDVDVDMNAVVRAAAAVLGGRGGGRPDFAQGAGDDAARLADAMRAARDAVEKALA
jgi:alanyl-tRNA synthetase